jgi:hypothetical protein
LKPVFDETNFGLFGATSQKTRFFAPHTIYTEGMLFMEPLKTIFYEKRKKN